MIKSFRIIFIIKNNKIHNNLILKNFKIIQFKFQKNNLYNKYNSK